MQNKKAIVIGAGIAGIAAAIRLKNLNFDVQVYETCSCPGGKIAEMYRSGYRFDCGPSLFTMPHYIDELFEISGKKASDYFQYEKQEVICNYFYEDGTHFTALADIEEFAKEAENKFAVTANEVKEYLKRSKLKFDVTSPVFLEKSLHRLSTYLSPETIKAIKNINKLDLTKSLHFLNKQNFKDPRLVQYFDRYATYNGSSPYLASGIMSVIPHLEQYYGTFFPKGGMFSIVKSLYQLAIDIGVRFSFETKVEEILVKNKKVKGVMLDNTVKEANIVVSNMDIVPTYRNLLPNQKAPEKILRQPRSSSALIFYWGIKKQFPQLELHNIFFSANYREEFKSIFSKKQVYDDPTIYINITSKKEPKDAPDGCENWFVMINVPCDERQDWEETITRSRKNILDKLSRIIDVNIAPLIETEITLDPREIEHKTQSFKGALYGASSNTDFAAFLRHPNFSKKIKNLYLCGGSVHPGGGIPLCLLSAKIVSELVENRCIL